MSVYFPQLLFLGLSGVLVAFLRFNSLYRLSFADLLQVAYDYLVSCIDAAFNQIVFVKLSAKLQIMAFNFILLINNKGIGSSASFSL